HRPVGFRIVEDDDGTGPFDTVALGVVVLGADPLEPGDGSFAADVGRHGDDAVGDVPVGSPAEVGLERLHRPALGVEGEGLGHGVDEQVGAGAGGGGDVGP